MTLKKYNKIFVIDDDEVNNFVTKRLLHQFDKEYEVTTYCNPVQAFDVLDAQKQEGNFPDMILLDINMPQMNGFEFLVKMDESGISDKIQVIMYSSSTYHEDRNKVKKHPNVIGYMEKPFSAHQYEKILEYN